jgi:hypothetical protein
MAIKTFTTGEVLTASDTNTYLANSGLVYVGTTTLTTNTQIDNCFTSAFTNYRIVVNVDTHSGGASNMGAQLSTGGTPYTIAANYYYSGNEQPYAGGAFTTYSNNGVNAFWVVGRLNGNDAGVFVFDVLNPQVAQKKFFQNNYTDLAISGHSGGCINVTNAFDGIKIYHLSGQTVGGSVRIYGYRQV